MKDLPSEKAMELETSVHRAATQSKLMRHENEDLRESIDTKNQRKSHDTVLPLESDSNLSGGSLFFSPTKIKTSRAELAQKEAEQRDEKVRKANEKEFKASTKLLRENIVAEKKLATAKAREAAAQAKVEKAAQL